MGGRKANKTREFFVGESTICGPSQGDVGLWRKTLQEDGDYGGTGWRGEKEQPVGSSGKVTETVQTFDQALSLYLYEEVCPRTASVCIALYPHLMGRQSERL